MKALTSTAIQAVEYSEDRKELTVVFCSGQTWRYEGVSRRRRDQLVSAPSIGRAYHQLIRGQFRGYPVKAK